MSPPHAGSRNVPLSKLLCNPANSTGTPSKLLPTCAARPSRSPRTLPCFPSIRSSTTLTWGASYGTISAMRMGIRSETWRDIWRSIGATANTCIARQTRTPGTAIGVTDSGAVHRAIWAFIFASADLRAQSYVRCHHGGWGRDRDLSISDSSVRCGERVE
jgi:hypothetical protein